MILRFIILFVLFGFREFCIKENQFIFSSKKTPSCFNMIFTILISPLFIIIWGACCILNLCHAVGVCNAYVYNRSVIQIEVYFLFFLPAMLSFAATADVNVLILPLLFDAIWFFDSWRFFALKAFICSPENFNLQKIFKMHGM